MARRKKPTVLKAITTQTPADPIEAEAKKVMVQLKVWAMSFPIVVAMYDYQTKKQDELPLVVGDYVKVFEKSLYEWWRGEGPDGRVGWFPSGYVVEADTSTIGSHEEFGVEVPADGMPAPIHASQAKPGNVFFARCSSQVYDDLIFKKGEELQIIGPVEDGNWIRVKNAQNDEGNIQFEVLTEQDITIFAPQSVDDHYTAFDYKVAERKPTMMLSSTATASENQEDFRASHWLKNRKIEQKPTMTLFPPTNSSPAEYHEAIYSFNSSATGQISVSCREKLQVLSLSDDTPGWAEIRNSRNETGLVPKFCFEENNDIQSAPALPVPLTSMEKEVFFFVRMQREYAERYLEQAQEGQFLVRNSERYPGSYTLSMRGFDGNVEHFLIDVVEGILIMNGKAFPNMHLLMSHYQKVAILKCGENFLYMGKPLKRISQ